MAYQTYTTKALVCGSWSRNGADKTFLLFTRELGVVYATARSVREERSRQRYALQECAEVRVSLVRGRSGWRIGSVIDISHPVLAARDRQRRIAIVNLFRLIRRFIPGESPIPEVYDQVVRALELLESDPAIIDPEPFVLCVQFRVLHALGYVAPNDVESRVLQWSLERLIELGSDTVLHQIRRSVDRATTVSHL